jgi:hypothetical protein
MKKRDWSRFAKHRFSPLAIAGMVVAGIALAVVFAFLFGWVVMLLWNWLMPAIFGLPTITYWQAWGLVLLSHILIKGGWGGGDNGSHKCESHDRGNRASGRKPTDGDWCEECDECAWQNDCAKYARGWRRTSDGWKCDTADVKKDLADRLDGAQKTE